MAKKPLTINHLPLTKPSRVLVTGGAGFIGSHLVDALIDAGHDVFIIDNFCTGLKENVNPKAKLYEMDIGDDEVENVFKEEKPEVVFHIAAQINLRRSIEDPVLDTKDNVLASVKLMRYASDSGVKKFIFSSTGGGIYGEANQIPTPETFTPTPPSPYGLAKLTVEKYLELWRQLYGMDYVALRYANVYGPRQNAKAEAGVIAIFITQALRGEGVTINGDGEQTRDYIYVADVVRADLAAMRSGVTGAFNIGTGVETSVNEIFSKIVGITKTEIEAVRGPAIKGEVLRSALDCGKARSELGWESEVLLKDGLGKTLEFFRGKLNA